MSRAKQINGVWVMTERPKFNRNNNREPRAKPERVESLDCKHRSEEFTLADCATCRGTVKVKLFQCDKFGTSCTMRGANVKDVIALSCEKCVANKNND